MTIELQQIIDNWRREVERAKFKTRAFPNQPLIAVRIVDVAAVIAAIEDKAKNNE
jgi:hypothetical protein